MQSQEAACGAMNGDGRAEGSRTLSCMHQADPQALHLAKIAYLSMIPESWTDCTHHNHIWAPLAGNTHQEACQLTWQYRHAHDCTAKHSQLRLTATHRSWQTSLSPARQHRSDCCHIRSLAQPTCGAGSSESSRHDPGGPSCLQLHAAAVDPSPFYVIPGPDSDIALTRAGVSASTSA